MNNEISNINKKNFTFTLNGKKIEHHSPDFINIIKELDSESLKQLLIAFGQILSHEKGSRKCSYSKITKEFIDQYLEKGHVETFGSGIKIAMLDSSKEFSDHISNYILIELIERKKFSALLTEQKALQFNESVNFSL